MNTNKKYTILVADDIPDNIEILRNILQPHYTVKVDLNFTGNATIYAASTYNHIIRSKSI